MLFQKPYRLAIGAILAAAGLSVVFLLAAMFVAPSNEVEIQVMAAAGEENLPDTGGTPLLPEDLPPEPQAPSSAESVQESSAAESSAESSAPPSSGEAGSSAPESSAASEPVSAETPSGPPETEGSHSAAPGSRPQAEGSYSTERPSSQPASSAPASSKPASSAPPASSSAASSRPSESSRPASSAPAESSGPESSASSQAPSGSRNLRVSLGGSVTEGEPYEILCRIVEAEMGGSYNAEALKAQAVAAYSYILYENAAGRTPSLPSRTPTQATRDAVAAVLGQALYYGGSVAFTPYHASSAGYTNPSSEVWSGGFPYLIRVSSAYDPAAYCKNQRVSLPASTVKAKVESYLGVTLGDDPNGWFSNPVVNDSGYVSSLTVTDASGGSHTLTGRQMRENVLNYAIRSHAFTIAIEGGQVVFTTNGYGHGVGMSQTGANAYAQNDGWTYRQILSHYYPGTTLQ